MEAFPVNINTPEKFARLTSLLGQVQACNLDTSDTTVVSRAIIRYAQTSELPPKLTTEFLQLILPGWAYLRELIEAKIR